MPVACEKDLEKKRADSQLHALKCRYAYLYSLFNNLIIFNSTYQIYFASQERPTRAPEGPRSTTKPAPTISLKKSTSTPLRMGKPVQPITSISFLRVPTQYLEGLEIKGVLGVGASGRSYLASFHGAPTAVKIIEYNCRGSNTTVLSSMKVLSMPCPHSNVLHTYRVSNQTSKK